MRDISNDIIIDTIQETIESENTYENTYELTDNNNNNSINNESFTNNLANVYYNRSNQIFSKEIPPLNIVINILNLFIVFNGEKKHYEFTKRILMEKKVLEKMNAFIPELRKYYLKCKQSKYLENLTIKKFITLLRQILKPHDYIIQSNEKYCNNEKFTLYYIEKTKESYLKKINSTICFD